jgi:hypothetical protein
VQEMVVISLCDPRWLYGSAKYKRDCVDERFFRLKFVKSAVDHIRVPMFDLVAPDKFIEFRAR